MFGTVSTNYGGNAHTDITCRERTHTLTMNVYTTAETNNPFFQWIEADESVLRWSGTSWVVVPPLVYG